MDAPDRHSLFLQGLGLRISLLREAQGLSQRQFASMIELDRATLIHIECGVGNPKIRTLAKIADGLGVDLADLFAPSTAKSEPSARARDL